VVAAPQAQGDLAGDRRGDPPLHGFAQHQRLRVEPASLVHAPTQAAALLVVEGDRVLVVDGVDEAFVGHMQQRHARGLVDPARLRLDDAVLDLVGHAESVTAADLIGLEDQRHGIVEDLAVDRDRATGLEADGDLLGGDLDVIAPGGHAHDRFDDVESGVEELESLGLVGRTPDVRIGRVGLLGRIAVRVAVFDEPFAHLLAPAELLDELRVEPGLVDAQLRVGHEAVAVEALDVIALVGRAVAPDVDAVLLHGAPEPRPGDRTARGSGVEIGLAAGADVERAALQGDEALLDEQALGVDEAGDLCAVLFRAGCDAIEVGLVVLADIGRVGAGDGSLVAHPRDCAGGVQAAGEGDSNVLTDWERRQYFRHGTSLTASTWRVELLCIAMYFYV